MDNIKLFVTLWPSFPHFNKFVYDTRLAGIRLNSAMVSVDDLDRELPLIPPNAKVPLYFDIKGRQLRVAEVHENKDYLDLTLNHPIKATLTNDGPTVLFKGGEDSALLAGLFDGSSWYGRRRLPDPNGWYQRLAFRGGPNFLVRAGESLCIRDPSLQVGGSQFTEAELKKIDKVKKAGFTRWFLSYVQGQRDVDEFLELIGKDSEVMLKIENKKGLEYVANEFVKRDNLKLVVAKGDLFVELEKPHEIIKAQKLIIEKDKEAQAASRMMLSVFKKVPKIVNGQIHYTIEPNEVPSDADFEQLAWLCEIGYRNLMLCDELCTREDLLDIAVGATCAFKDAYE